MEEPGHKLKQTRDRLNLTYRDVQEASQQIANLHGRDEFIVGLSRLADIEHKGTLPSIYRLYSLCAIYRLEFRVVLRWYGIELGALPVEAALLPLRETYPVDFEPDGGGGQTQFPAEFDDRVDLRQTVCDLLAGGDLGSLIVHLLLDFGKLRCLPDVKADTTGEHQAHRGTQRESLHAHQPDARGARPDGSRRAPRLPARWRSLRGRRRIDGAGPDVRAATGAASGGSDAGGTARDAARGARAI